MWVFYEIQISVSINEVFLKHSYSSWFTCCAKWYKMLSARGQRWVAKTETECPTKSDISCLTLCTPVPFRLARGPLTPDPVFLSFALDPSVISTVSSLPCPIFFGWHSSSVSPWMAGSGAGDGEWASQSRRRTFSPKDHQSFHAIGRDSVFSLLEYSLEEFLNFSLCWAHSSLFRPWESRGFGKET